MLVGYYEASYRIFFPETGQIGISKDLRMIEATLYRKVETIIDLEKPVFFVKPVEV